MRRLAAALLLVGCTQPDPAPSRVPHAAPGAVPAPAAPVKESVAFSPDAPPAPTAGELALGVRDQGIYPDLDAKLQLLAPPASPELRGVVDEERALLTLYAKHVPLKVYPLGGPHALEVGGVKLQLRPGDAAELGALLSAGRIESLPAGTQPEPGDRDRDGIPDPLDVLIGAHKAALNGAHYSDGYFSMGYPNGDAPRDKGACVDVVVRAIRNAGLDLQIAVADDLRRDPGYGIKQPDRNIDHRRVRNVLRYFKRHWQSHSTGLDDPDDPLQPGDIVFLDTFTNRDGPEHLGVLSEQRSASGKPLVINNWTFGYHTQAMDLLAFVKVTHRFRFPSVR